MKTTAPELTVLPDELHRMYYYLQECGLTENMALIATFYLAERFPHLFEEIGRDDYLRQQIDRFKDGSFIFRSDYEGYTALCNAMVRATSSGGHLTNYLKESERNIEWNYSVSVIGKKVA